MLPVYQMTRLADVRPGMELSDDVLDAKGHVLLTQGVIVTDAILAGLARHDIDSLPILQVAPTPAAAALDTMAIQARLDHLFRTQVPTQQDNPDAGLAMRTLRQYMEDYRLQREVAP
jgi:hypothetical protein